MWSVMISQPRPRATRRACGTLFSCLFLPVLLGCSAGGERGRGDIDALSALVAVEDLRIGDAEDPDRGFSRIGGVDVDRDGQLFVFEMMDQQIRVYDPTGALVRAFGREGDGPGEFRRVDRFGVAGDTLWVSDSGLRRLTLFDRTGNVLSTAPLRGVSVNLQNPRLSGTVLPRALRPDGLFTSDMFWFTGRRDPTPTGIGENDTVMVPRVLFDGNAMPVDTVGWYPRPPTEGVSQWVELKGTRYYVPSAPRDDVLRVMMDDGGYYLSRPFPTSAEPATFVVTRVAESGDTMFERRFSYTPVRYGSAVLDTVAWESARIPGGMYNPATGPDPTPEGLDINVVQQTIRDAMHWPEFQIPVDFGFVGDDGTLWLRREDDGGPDYRYMVLDANAEPRGLLDLPRGLRVRWVSADRFWVQETDELGVPWLVRYRYGEALTGTR